MISDKKILKDFIFFLSFVAMATRVFEGIKFFQKILEKTMAGTFLWNFIKIRWVVSEKRCLKKRLTHTLTHAHTIDNGPWHKLAGLWPVELKIKPCVNFGIECQIKQCWRELVKRAYGHHFIWCKPVLSSSWSWHVVYLVICSHPVPKFIPYLLNGARIWGDCRGKTLT